MAAGDRIRNGIGAEGIERMEASFHGRPFSPHRHDTYAIGLTISGVQTFNFRGQRWHCLPGECHILHPDETHDGSAGTEEGFSYRMVYVDPALVQQALHGQPLPFVANPVVDARRLAALDVTDVWDIDEDIDDLARVDLIASLARLLVHASADPQKKPAPLALERLVQVRDLLAGTPAVRHSMDELERVAGLDRWALARQFRAAFGTSPSHFRTHRQLDQLRRAVKGGASLRDAALDAGFADQSHMSRQFKRAYGLTPAKWAEALG
ncbi:MAG: AraC family transcriptional regulator [Paraburkholderia sp.]|jgi:AraC-like DNA-binding protein|uniref:AraC family transcriptional regulator n=1 Tax=Burkholderiaceae TaxID=119060 RepID=UPI0010F6C0F9|nr:AraC family transcriptional regulator [Burkholderia sp. 4M9327F10]